MHAHLSELLLHWGIMALALWSAAGIFKGISFSSGSSLLISALMLGLANAIIRPVLILLTFPLTLLSLGFFVLVINALMVMLVSSLVKGFELSGFWTAFFVSLFISIFSLCIEALIPGNSIIILHPYTTSTGISV